MEGAGRRPFRFDKADAFIPIIQFVLIFDDPGLAPFCARLRRLEEGMVKGLSRGITEYGDLLNSISLSSQ